ncbi:hypothetical protein Calab_3326 [Caldithrix abyssi DSM 13497]|uniref:Uncharacterized protein n=2 Tax=Caldithrix abyssi TaxID=187145 RepID=H1XVN0_CALAY|nr:DUF6804 family protein [Caldithrix abyssi]APF18977.1 hypothetical protein Cabys_2228 [Caldithrix abyssi DSM 13497]EHO42930.1 hypothetical protein Calab_3326 [Caldithrix abyssi DSM 13497]
MVLNNQKNMAITISIIFLFLALFEGWPYGFYTLLRLIVFAATAFLAWLAYKCQKHGWIWIFGFMALLFNPLIPVHLGRELWMMVDLFVAIFLIISIFVFKLPEDFK